MSQPSHWITKIVDDLEQRGDLVTVFSTAKTPSGPIHVGVGRELIYCSAFEKLLRKRGHDTRFLFFVDDFDPLKSFPTGTPTNFTKETAYLGVPLYKVPCPYGDCRSWGEHYARELFDTFPDFGLYPEIIFSHELYQTSQMKSLIRLSLKRVEEIRRIFDEVVSPTLSGEQLQVFKRDLLTWYPCLALCRNCGRLKTGVVTSYDANSDSLTYLCSACGEKGEVPVESWPIKLRWRVDWPAKWALFKVSCEPAGKDHCVKGGAYDTGVEICNRIFNCKGPYRIPYEWILLGDRAMKTHKGIS
ncbi:MAG: lysine--tRNA ligase, partial [Candidatus Bathyarchaeia archaeon]